jgi:hypothetical protein
VHFTPDYSKDPLTGQTYKFYNKPHGLLHWLEHGLHATSSAKSNGNNKNSEKNDTTSTDVVALIDPDMLFLRPITGLFPKGQFLVSQDWKPGEEWARVEKGRPAGQQYGLG